MTDLHPALVGPIGVVLLLLAALQWHFRAALTERSNRLIPGPKWKRANYLRVRLGVGLLAILGFLLIFASLWPKP